MTNPSALELLRRAELHLSALHGSVGRHDNLAANLACGGCELRDEISAALPELAAVQPPADRAADGTALLREAADWYAQQGKTVLAASQVAADLRRRADSETTAVSFARMLAGAAVLSGRSDALPFDDEEMPAAERERYLTQARQLLARAAETPAATPEAQPKCGAWGGCPLPMGHNRGRADIPENHHGLSEDLFTGPQWETRDPEAEERERDIQREARG